MNTQLIHNNVSCSFNRKNGRVVTIRLKDSSIEQVIEKAINLGFVPIKWYQFWRMERLEINWMHKGLVGIVITRGIV